MNDGFWLYAAITASMVTVVFPIVYGIMLRDKMWAVFWALMLCLVIKWGFTLFIAEHLMSGPASGRITQARYPWQYPLFSMLFFPATIGEYWLWILGSRREFPFLAMRLATGFILMILLEANLLFIIKRLGLHQFSYRYCIKIASVTNSVSYGSVILIFTLLLF